MEKDPNIIALVSNTTFFEKLDYYINLRVEKLKEELTMAKGERVTEVQGAIVELRVLKALRANTLSKFDKRGAHG